MSVRRFLRRNPTISAVSFGDGPMMLRLKSSGRAVRLIEFGRYSRIYRDAIRMKES